MRFGGGGVYIGNGDTYIYNNFSIWIDSHIFEINGKESIMHTSTSFPLLWTVFFLLLWWVVASTPSAKWKMFDLRKTWYLLRKFLNLSAWSNKIWFIFIHLSLPVSINVKTVDIIFNAHSIVTLGASRRNGAYTRKTNFFFVLEESS